MHVGCSIFDALSGAHTVFGVDLVLNIYVKWVFMLSRCFCKVGVFYSVVFMSNVVFMLCGYFMFLGLSCCHKCFMLYMRAMLQVFKLIKMFSDHYSKPFLW